MRSNLESPRAARQRAADLIEQDSAPMMILQMLHLERPPFAVYMWFLYALRHLCARW